MDNYIKTIINGLKAWVTNGLNRLEESMTKLSGNLTIMGDKITSLTSKVTKNTADIAKLYTGWNDTWNEATNAKIAADNAQATANTAMENIPTDDHINSLINAKVDSGAVKVYSSQDMANEGRGVFKDYDLNEEYTLEEFKQLFESSVVIINFSNYDSTFESIVLTLNETDQMIAFWNESEENYTKLFISN